MVEVAAACDFVDVYALSRTFDKHARLALAAEIDAGFEQTVFADVLAYLSRYSDADLQLRDVDVVALRCVAYVPPAMGRRNSKRRPTRIVGEFQHDGGA